MTLRPLIVLAVLLAASASAETVLVASMGAPKESQTAVVRALAGRPGVTSLIVAPPTNGSDPALRAQLISEKGAAALLLLRVKPGGKALRLELFDTAGRSAWSSELPLKRGKLGGDKKKMAMAVVREIRALPPPQRAPAPVPEPPAVAPPPAAPAPSAPVAEREPPARVQPAPVPRKSRTASTPAVRRPAPPPPAVEVEQTGGPRSLATPLVELSAGGTLLWRTYEFCPGVQRCGQKILGGLPGAAKYVTESPYLGPAVRVAAFPLAGYDSLIRGIGLGGSYARGWLRTAVPGAIPGETEWLSTTDEDFSAELIFRYALKLGWGEAFAGARAGVVGRRFILPDNALLTESRRHVAPAFALELGVPLIAGVRLDAGGRYALAPTPGAVEQAAYGSDAVSSSGLFVSVGLSGQLAGSGWGWAATYEYALFQDAFTGTGERASGGAAREEYQGVIASARYRF